MFNKLREAVNSYYDFKIDELKKKKIDDIINFYGTNNVKEKCKCGVIAIDRAYQLSLRRGIREFEKYRIEQLKLLEECEDSEDVNNINISVEWIRNKTCGYNPHVTITVFTKKDTYTYTETASGCGYDKESSAIAAALENSREVKKELFLLCEKILNKKEIDFSKIKWNELLAYGCGYGILPYFEGGVGVNCFFNIFEKIGFNCKRIGSGKHFDVYTINKVVEV